MDPRPHNPVLTRNNFIWIELYGPQIIQAVYPLRLELRNMFLLVF